VFRDEVLRLTRTVARNAVVTVVPGPGVTIESVVGHQAVASGRGLQVAVGDLAEGQVRDLFVRLAVGARRAGAAVELVDATLSFDDALVGAGRLERTLFLGARATADRDEHAAGRDADVEAQAEQVVAAALTLEAIRRARAGEVEAARRLLAAGAEHPLAGPAGGAPAAPSPSYAELDAVLAEIEAPATPSGLAVGAGGARGHLQSSPARAPAASEHRLRGVHERALNRIIGDKC
jgi:hypothetical protein